MKNSVRILLAFALIFTCLSIASCDALVDDTDSTACEHSLVEHEAKAPTCTQMGWESYYTCSLCEEYSTYKALEPLGHAYSTKYTENGEVHTVSCGRCDEVSHQPHDWKLYSYSAPDCDSDGEQSYKCSVCDAEKHVCLSALGHDFSSKYKPNGDVHSDFCKRCAYTVSKAHEWKLTDNVESTCTTEGSQTYRCSDCGGTKTVTSSALGHDYGEDFKPNGDHHSIFCSRCDSTIADHPHDWQISEIIEEATCSAEGKAKLSCSVCGALDEQAIPTSEHEAGQWVITRLAEAIEPGIKTLKCAVCSGDIYSVTIPADVEYMPIVYLTGNYLEATAAKNEVDMTVRYVDPDGSDSFDAYATIKVQGASSAAYAKKNYTIKFFKNEDHSKKYKVDLGWGKENKYVMKANWVDFSQARNVVSCRLWGDIVKSRAYSANQQRLAALPTNGGAIDGYPIAVFMNGEFHGLYTMNVPKDEWMFGMGDSETEALIAADNWVSTCFTTTLDGFIVDENGDLTSNNKGWELRYYGTEDTTGSHAWVTESFNRLIVFCQNNQGSAFKSGISQYLDVDAAIDYLIFMYANCMHDNASKNMLWATYDGKTWIPSVYDQDGTFGQVWDGIRLVEANRNFPSIKNGKIDVGINYGPPAPTDSSQPRFILWDRMWNTFTSEIIARYYQLRATTLSTQNMISELREFCDAVPASIYVEDAKRWQTERNAWWSASSYSSEGSSWSYDEYHFEYMYQWVADRMMYYDNVMVNISNYFN